jgi:hypothetical protein
MPDKTNATNSAERRMKDLGISLPRPPTPLGAYVEAVQSGNLLFLSGTLPVEAGVPQFLGRIACWRASSKSLTDRAGPCSRRARPYPESTNYSKFHILIIY